MRMRRAFLSRSRASSPTSSAYSAPSATSQRNTRPERNWCRASRQWRRRVIRPDTHRTSSHPAPTRSLIQADVTAGAATLFLNHPDWKLVFDTDGPLAEQTRRKVYDMAVADKMLIQGYHFPFPGRGHVEKSGSGYRLVPAA